MMAATWDRDSDTASGVTDAPHLTAAARNVRGPGANLFFLTMLRQQSQYDSRLGFSFRVLVRVRLRVGVRGSVTVMVRVLG